MEFPHLFNEALIGNLSVRNRIVMAPLCSSLSFGDGRVSERMIDYYSTRAQGGVGLIISEYICIDSKLGRAKSSQLILDHDDLIGSHNLLTERIHRFNECKIIAQLHHAGRQTNKTLTRDLQAVEILHKKVMQISTTIYRVGHFESSYLKGLKCTLSCMGICSDFLAEPFHRFRSPERDVICRHLVELGIVQKE